MVPSTRVGISKIGAYDNLWIMKEILRSAQNDRKLGKHWERGGAFGNDFLIYCMTHQTRRLFPLIAPKRPVILNGADEGGEVKNLHHRLQTLNEAIGV